jgi:heme exporter protein B
MTGAGVLAKTKALVGKDVRSELRGRDTLAPMLAFAFVVTLVLAFTLPKTRPLTDESSAVLSGFLWVTVLFAGLIGFARTFAVEREDGAIDALLLAPLDRSALFAAKAVTNLSYIFVIEVVLVPVFALLFNLGLGSSWGTLLLVILLVDVGFAAVGTLFAALASHTRSRELVLPILALPVLIPVFIAAVELSAQAFTGGRLTDLQADGWFAILIAFDIIFVVLGALTFEQVVD